MNPQAPLKGLKVVEFAGIGPAPLCGMMFADMGAEVILVERKVANPNGAGILAEGDPGKLAIHNRGKQSIAVDLRQQEGVDLALALIERADILIEGFRPGVMERLGLGPQNCHARNPRLIYGRLTGWGQTGPLAKSAGHDPNYIALSGAMWYGGQEGTAPGAPLTLAGDVGGGTLVLAWGILCALHSAQATGSGQVVDAAITDGSAYISSLLWMMYNSGQVGEAYGQSWIDGAAPWNATYQCADGHYVTICSLEPKFYRELLQLLELSDDPLFISQWDKRHWPRARQRLTELFLSRTRQQWCELLEGSDVCFAPVLNFAEAPTHPHNVARGTFVDLDGVMQPALAPRLSQFQPAVGTPPKPGEHTRRILQALGLDDSRLEKLIRDQVI